jgi:hypothetical protein
VGGAPAVNHQPEFTAACVRGRRSPVLDGAIVMAWTAADLAGGAA